MTSDAQNGKKVRALLAHYNEVRDTDILNKTI
jgi:hypothetical protein